MGDGLRIGRIAGVDVRVDASLALIAALVTLNMWQYLADLVPGIAPGAALVAAGVTAVVFFASILAHEVAHAVTAKARGVQVDGIRLYMFGGVTYTRGESRGPAEEFLIAVVGPLTSLLLGGVFLGTFFALRDITPRTVDVVLFYLGGVNLALGLFNLLPGFPLDGGRLVRAAAWKLTGSMGRGTRVAARGGQAVGLLISGWGLYVMVRGGGAAGLWPLLIGWMLFREAGQALVGESQRRQLATVTAGQVMSPPPPAVPPDMPAREVFDRYLRDHDGEAFPVMDRGRLLGFVSAATIAEADPERPAREVAVPTTAVTVASRVEPMDEVVRRLREMGAQTALVVNGVELVGVIEPEDLMRSLAGEPQVPPRPDVQTPG